MLMIKSSLKTIAVLALFIGAVVTYLYFFNYEPKSLKKIEDVKAASKGDVTDYLYPGDAKQVGVTKSNKTTQITYTTKKSQDELIPFYQIMLNDQGWDVDSLNKTKDSYIYKLKKPGKAMTIISQNNNGETVVSIEIYLTN